MSKRFIRKTLAISDQFNTYLRPGRDRDPSAAYAYASILFAPHLPGLR
jgi:hypothetical protein